MDTIADAGATCGPTPAHATSPSRRPSHAASTQATAAAQPSPHPRSAITSASRRPTPITRSLAVSRRARSAAPIPEAEPVTAMTRTRTLLYLRGGAQATDSRAGERCGGWDTRRAAPHLPEGSRGDARADGGRPLFSWPTLSRARYLYRRMRRASWRAVCRAQAVSRRREVHRHEGHEPRLHAIDDRLQDAVLGDRRESPPGLGTDERVERHVGGSSPRWRVRLMIVSGANSSSRRTRFASFSAVHPSSPSAASRWRGRWTSAPLLIALLLPSCLILDSGFLRRRSGGVYRNKHLIGGQGLFTFPPRVRDRDE